MKKLSLEALKRAESFIMENGRELEKARYNYFFNNGSSEEVIEELSIYQNSDGGFGHGLEPDFILPNSSPMASTVAFQIIDEINSENAEHLIKSGIEYFENTYNQNRAGWFALPKEVNDYPHAPWWNYDLASNMTVIDHFWGNPSAEIIGYLINYRDYVRILNIETLLEISINKLFARTDFKSEHEIYCYLRLYNKLPAEKKNLVQDKLTKAVQSLISHDPQEWLNYTPQPIHFVNHPEIFSFGISKQEIENNLNYLQELIETRGVILPTWEWGQYEEAWMKSKGHWAGVLTLQTLRTLFNFGRI